MSVGLLCEQLLLLTAGYGILYVLGLARLRAAEIRLVGLAYLVGWALVGILLTFALESGVPLTVWTVLAAVGLTVAICAWLGRGQKLEESAVESAPSGSRLARAVEWAGLVLVGIPVVASIAAARATEWNAATQYDAFWFWIPKAEAISYTHRLDPHYIGALTSPEYPPLLSVMDASTFEFSGGMHPSFLVTQRTLLGIAFLLAIATLLARGVPRWVAYPSVGALASAPWFWSRLGSPMADQTVAYLLAPAAIAGALWVVDARRRWLGLALVLLMAASLTKFEGLLFGAFLAAALLVAGCARHRKAALPAFALLLAPAAIVPWHVWLSRHGLRTNSNDYRLSDVLHPGFLRDRGLRLTYALREMRRTAIREVQALLGGQETRNLGGWVLAVPWCAGLVLAVRRIPALALAVVAWFGLSFFGLATIYWIGKLEVGYYVNTTVRRVEPTLIIVLAVSITFLLGRLLARPERLARPSASVRFERMVAVVAAAAVIAAVLVADSRPGTSRTGRVDVPALDRELAAQFHLERLAGTYDFPISADCSGTTPDSLTFACVLTTTRPVGTPPKVLTWNETMTCTPPPVRTQRCVTDQGEAIG